MLCVLDRSKEGVFKGYLSSLALICSRSGSCLMSGIKVQGTLLRSLDSLLSALSTNAMP